MNKKQKSFQGKRNLNKAFSFLIIALTSVVVLFPIYWLVVTSLKTESEIYRIPPSVFPIKLTLENYDYALHQTKIPIYFLNSIIYAGGTLLVVIVCASLAAYSMSRFKFKGKAPYLMVVLLTQLMPLTTLIVPLYIIFGQFGWMNNRLAIIAVYSAIQIPIALWLLLGYFNSIPREIDEAATIDGCSKFQILMKMIMPLSKPGIMAVSISVLISIWQEFMLAMNFTSVDTLRPLMAGVSASITKAGIKWGQINATGLIALIPILIIYLFSQKNLIQGLTGGAVKG